MNFKILFICLYGLGISINTKAQECDMLNGLPGYSTCCNSDEPVECLMSFINSIENEESFYKEMDGSDANYIKAQYLLQVGLTFKGLDKNDLAMQQIRKSLMAIELAKTFNKADKAKLDTLMWVVQHQGADLCKKLKAENIEDYHACNCDQFLSDYKMYLAWKHEQENPSTNFSFASQKSDYILKVIRQHAAKNPPPETFKNKLAIDTTILQIDHYIKNRSLSKECLIIKSSYQHLYGESLMGIANVLQFKTSEMDLSFDIEIRTQPGELNQVSFKNGIFWIEYSSEIEEIEQAEEIVEVIKEEVQPTPEAINDPEYILYVIRQHVSKNPPVAAFTKTNAIDTTILQVDHYIKSGRLSKECQLVQSNNLRLNGEGLMKIANDLQFKTSEMDLSIKLEIITQPGKENKVYFENGAYWIEYQSL